SSLWLRAEYLPPKRRRDNSHVQLPKQYKLDYVQRERARKMALAGSAVRNIAGDRHCARQLEERLQHGTLWEELDLVLPSTRGRSATMAYWPQGSAARLPVEAGMV